MSTNEHSREKILRAALQHFAKHGLEDASVRAISKAAGVNHALIGYNFGSKLALYEAVLERCTELIIRPRMEALNKLEAAAKGKPVPLKKLVDAYIRGFFQDYENPNGAAATYLRFYGRVYTEPGGDVQGIIIKTGEELRERYLQAFAKTLPHFSRRDLVYRFGALIANITFWGAKTGFMDAHFSEHQIVEQEELLETIIAMGCAQFKVKPISVKSKSTGSIKTATNPKGQRKKSENKLAPG